MHKLTINRARIDLAFTPKTPLLVKSGDKGAQLLHPERPDLMCVRTHHGARGETVYVPGSSLKGVVRSAAERVLRSLELPCCDPMNHKSRCHDEASKRGDAIARGREAAGSHPMGEVHGMLCLACRSFGSQAIASRVSFADAYPTEQSHARANHTETRNGVSIDRMTGGPARGKLFELEVVVGGDFATSIHFANFELWQLGLVGVVLADLDDGFVRLGSAKTRGLGRVSVALSELVVDQIGAGGGLAGVGTLRSDLVDSYDLLERDLRGPSGEARVSALGQRLVWKGNEACRRALDEVVERAWPTLLKRRGAAA
ncbi:MAG: CRISPR-associated RAMP protein [Sandaracinaceae bacterium]|nr:CRISPR-associated RAMP protein [Sandaracinaceae bacterium]